MIAADKTSNALLEESLNALNASLAVRAVVKLAYDLGKCDGALVGSYRALEAIKGDPALGAEACVTRDGVIA